MSDLVRMRLALAVTLAEESVAAGGGPFGALLVTEDGRTFEATNTVARDNDPTAHAEMAAIRKACRALGTHELRGATLYASCEPCPMCLGAALWARVARVYYAADRHAAAEAGFHNVEFREFFASGGQGGPLRVEQVPFPGASAPLHKWRASAARVEY